MKKFTKTIMVAIATTFLFASCASVSDTKKEEKQEDVYEHSYRSEPLSPGNNQRINIPNELPNFTIDYFEGSKMLPPLFETKKEGILYALYPVNPMNEQEEYYGLIIHAYREGKTVTPLAIEYCYEGESEYWVYSGKGIPNKATLEAVKHTIQNLIEEMKERASRVEI